MAEIESPDPKSVAFGFDLPARPATVADVPPDASLRRGPLVWFRSRNGRPVVSVAVRCPRCKYTHWHPWRWDWGLDVDAASFQAARCRDRQGRPHWVALDPDPEARAVQARAHGEAHEAFLLWGAARLERRAAALAAEPPPAPSAPAEGEAKEKREGDKAEPVAPPPTAAPSEALARGTRRLWRQIVQAAAAPWRRPWRGGRRRGRLPVAGFEGGPA